MVGKPNPENRKAVEWYGNIRIVGVVPFLKKINRETLVRVFHKSFDHQVFHT